MELLRKGDREQIMDLINGFAGQPPMGPLMIELATANSMHDMTRYLLKELDVPADYCNSRLLKIATNTNDWRMILTLATAMCERLDNK